MAATRTVIVETRITVALNQRLTALAERDGTTKADELRRAIELWLSVSEQHPEIIAGWLQEHGNHDPA